MRLKNVSFEVLPASKEGTDNGCTQSAHTEGALEITFTVLETQTRVWPFSQMHVWDLQFPWR